MRRYWHSSLVCQMGNNAKIEGGPIALESALRRATANATQTVPLRLTVYIHYGEQITTTMLALERLRLNMDLNLRVNGSI